MKKIAAIIMEAKTNRWPYPKTFEALKEAGVKLYRVKFSEKYQTEYQGDFGSWTEKPPVGYHPIKVAPRFSGEGIKAAIIRHMKEHTSFVEFLEDIAASGASHYEVDMAKRTVTYFNLDSSQYQQEHVPE